MNGSKFVLSIHSKYIILPHSFRPLLHPLQYLDLFVSSFDLLIDIHNSSLPVPPCPLLFSDESGKKLDLWWMCLGFVLSSAESMLFGDVLSFYLLSNVLGSGGVLFIWAHGG